MTGDAKKVESRNRRLSRLILARNSIFRARRDAAYAVANIKSENDPVFHAFECAVVVCYARPFVGTKNANSGRISGGYERFPDRPALKPLHDYLISHRHAFVAHTSEALNKVGFVKPGGRLKSNVSDVAIIAAGEAIYSRHIRLSVFSQIIDLCDFQLKRIADDIDKEASELVPEMRPDIKALLAAHKPP